MFTPSHYTDLKQLQRKGWLGEIQWKAEAKSHGDHVDERFAFPETALLNPDLSFFLFDWHIDKFRSLKEYIFVKFPSERR